MGKKLNKLRPPLPTISSTPQDEIVFSFKGLKMFSFAEAKNDSEFFIQFLERLSKISSMTWSSAYTTQKHGIGGIESMKVQSLNVSAQKLVPSGVESLITMRATGDNHVFLGYREKNVFNVMFIEYAFGDVYDHGC